MEFLLLWADELDDALGALRHLAPKILVTVLALALLAVTGFALALAPQTVLFAIGCALCALLLESVRRRQRLVASDS